MDKKQRLFEVMKRLNPEFKFAINENDLSLSNNELNERNASEINPKYSHFAILKSNNKIVNGWDYGKYEQDELNQFKKDYFFNDINDIGIDPKLVEIYTKKALERKGINPFDMNNWFKFEAEGWRDRNELN